MGPMTRGKMKNERARTQYADGSNDSSENSCNFRSLLANLQTPQGIKPHVLKDFYGLLVHLSSCGKCGDEIKVVFAAICKISDILFKELGERFEQFFTAFGNKDEDNSHGDALSHVELIHFLLRCCLLLLPLFVSRKNLMLEKGEIILKILGRLSSPNLVDKKQKQASVFEKSVIRRSSLGDNGCSSSSVEDFTASLQFLDHCSNPSSLLMSTMLEVFVDELSVHKQLRGYLNLIKSSASESVQNDISFVIEAVCYHFIISISDKIASADFLDRLFHSTNKEKCRPFISPALGVTAAVSLLLSPIMYSAPKYLQAHLISLVTEAVDIKISKPDPKLTNCFLAAFEKSIISYMNHMGSMKIDGLSLEGLNSSSPTWNGFALPQFEQFVSPQTKDRVNNLIAELDRLSSSILENNFFGTKSDMVTSSMRFLKDCQKLHSIACCQDEILSILSFLVLKASESFSAMEVRPIEGISLHDVYLLASILKLMGISLLQAVSLLTDREDQFEVSDSSSEYNFILGAMTCFGDLNKSLPLQQFLFDALAKDSTTASKMMFLHFSGLMSLAFANGLGCLVNGCLLALFALLNLFSFEKDGLTPLKTLLDSNEESISSRSVVVRFQETVAGQYSGSVLAAKFQKIRSLYTSVGESNNGEMLASTSESLGRDLQQMETDVDLEEETINGEIFLNCMMDKKESVADFDDLAGFIECKQGKDYSAWLKNRERYRKWKSEKRAVLKWKRKKMTWKAACKRNQN